MYSALLALHSLVRWLVLAGLLSAIYRAFVGWRYKKKFTLFDNSLRRWAAAIAHVQLVIGLWLYFISPFAVYFLHNFPASVHQREFRFFGMEHSLMISKSKAWPHRYRKIQGNGSLVLNRASDHPDIHSLGIFAVYQQALFPAVLRRFSES